MSGCLLRASLRSGRPPQVPPGDTAEPVASGLGGCLPVTCP
jgi:hypothetical protein